MSLLSTFILSGAAVPHSNSNKLSDNHNMFNHLFIKQEMNLSAQSGEDGFDKSSPLEESITSKSLRQLFSEDFYTYLITELEQQDYVKCFFVKKKNLFLTKEIGLYGCKLYILL